MKHVKPPATTKPEKKQRAKEVGFPIQVRLQADLLDWIDEWRRAQPDLPGRPEALRRMADSLRPGRRR